MQRLPIIVPRPERGAALVVSMVFLLVISVLAVSSTRTTTLQERMAGNVRDRNLAFQAAESGIREAEERIENFGSLAELDGTGGLYGLADAEPYHTNAAVWSDHASYAVADEHYGAHDAPRYYVKHFTTVTGIQGAMNMSGYGDNKGTGDVSVFRITGRGTGGGVDSAEVVIRTQYGRIF